MKQIWQVYEKKLSETADSPKYFLYPEIIHANYLLPNNSFGITGSCNLFAFLPLPDFTCTVGSLFRPILGSKH